MSSSIQLYMPISQLPFSLPPTYIYTNRIKYHICIYTFPITEEYIYREARVLPTFLYTIYVYTTKYCELNATQVNFFNIYRHLQESFGTMCFLNTKWNNVINPTWPFHLNYELSIKWFVFLYSIPLFKIIYIITNSYHILISASLFLLVLLSVQWYYFYLLYDDLDLLV